MVILQVTALLALLFSAWELSVNWEEDNEFIWSTPRQYSLIRFLYILARYGPLLIQPCTIALALTLGGHYPTIPAEMCKQLLLYQTVITYSLLRTLNLIMIIRIQALYNLSKRTGFPLGLIFVTCIAIPIYSAVAYIPKQEFSEKCTPSIPQNAAVFSFAIPEVALQVLFVVLTAGRTFSLKRHNIPSIMPLLRRLTQDGWIIFFVMTVFSGVVLFFNFAPIAHSGKFEEWGQVVFPTITTLLCSASCRLVLNLRRLPVHGSNSMVSSLGADTVPESAESEADWDAEIALEKDGGRE